MSLAIVTDSLVDFSPEEREKLNIVLVPLKIELDGKTYVDQQDVTSEQFLDLMEASENLPKSSAPAPLMFQETFEELIAQGYDEIISMHLSPKLSGTLQSAELAAQTVMEAHPEAKIAVFNTRGATASQGLLVMEAARMRDAGMDLEATVNALDELASKTRFLVACKTLDNLIKNGRLTSYDAEQINMLNIKPVFTFNEEGSLLPFAKVRGMKGVVSKYAEEVIDAVSNAKGEVAVRFCHSRNEKAVENVRKALEEAGITYTDYGSCVTGSIAATHLGIGAVGVSFAEVPSL